MSDDIYSKKLREIIDSNMMNGLLEAPIEIVARSVTLQDKNGVQMTSTLKTENFIEEEEE